jgi:hypothetical protein
MTIDWDKLETLRNAKPEPEPLPAGWFRATDYGERFGISNDAAYSRLTRMSRRGTVEREKFGADENGRITIVSI